MKFGQEGLRNKMHVREADGNVAIPYENIDIPLYDSSCFWHGLEMTRIKKNTNGNYITLTFHV